MVRRGACVIHVASIEEAAQLVFLLERGKAMMQDAEVDSGIARVAKHTLDLLEKATCTTHQGLGAAARAARKLLGNRATKKVLQLHEAACFTRHLTDMGEEQFVQSIAACLASSLEHHEACPPPPSEPTRRGASLTDTSSDSALVEHDDSQSTTANGESGTRSSGRSENSAAPVQPAEQQPGSREHCTSPGVSEASSGELIAKLIEFYVRFNPGHAPHAAKLVASNGGNLDAINDKLRARYGVDLASLDLAHAQHDASVGPGSTAVVGGEPHSKQPAPIWTEDGGPELACKDSSRLAATAQWQSAKVRRQRKPLRRCRLPADDDAS